MFLRESPPMSLYQLELRFGYRAFFGAVLAHFWAFPARSGDVRAAAADCGRAFGKEFAALASFFHCAPLGGNNRQREIANASTGAKV